MSLDIHKYNFSGKPEKDRWLDKVFPFFWMCETYIAKVLSRAHLNMTFGMERFRCQCVNHTMPLLLHAHYAFSKWTPAITQALTFITVCFIFSIWAWDNTISLCGAPDCLSVWISVVIHRYLEVHLHSQKPGQRTELIADASPGRKVVCSTPHCLKDYMCKMAPVWIFALACCLGFMQMESMYSGAVRRSTSVQSESATTLDPVSVSRLAFKFRSWFYHTNWILVLSLDLTGLK